jgi:APA family basic amino acid/polyamine antiporter
LAKIKLGLLSAVSLVIANMVGTGIFTSLGFQVGDLPSASVLLFLWLMGGIVALLGGLSYIQLAKQIPGEGGEYHYIQQAYPRFLSAFAGLVSVFGGFCAPIALACMACSAYLPLSFTLGLSQKTIALLLFSMISIFHMISLKASRNFQLTITLFKIISIIILVFFGLQMPEMANPMRLGPSEISMITSQPFAISLIYVSFAYSGWNACIYIFNDIENPAVTLKKAILIGTATVTLIYLALNFVFLKVLTLNEMKGILEIGALAAKKILGLSVGTMVGLLMSLLLISTISAMVWLGPSVIRSVAEKENLIWLAREDKLYSLRIKLIQYAIVFGLIYSGTFEYILAYSTVLMSICSILTVAILFTKRSSWLKLIAPSIYILVSCWGLFYILFHFVLNP